MLKNPIRRHNRFKLSSTRQISTLTKPTQQNILKKQHQKLTRRPKHQFLFHSTQSQQFSTQTSSPTSQPISNESQTPIPFKNDKLTQLEQERLMISTINFTYPNYYISSLPELEPTVPYAISPILGDYLSETLPEVDRVGTNIQKNNDQQLFDNLVSFVRKTGATISPSIGVSQFNLTARALNTPKTKSSSRFSTLTKVRRQNWGLIAKQHLKPSHIVMELPYTSFIYPTTGIQPTPDLYSLIRIGQLDDISPSQISDLNWMIESLRLIIGAVGGDGPILPWQYTASFALSLLGNRIIGKASAYYDYIQSLPAIIPSTYVMKSKKSQFYQTTAPYMNLDGDGIDQLTQIFLTSTGRQFLQYHHQVNKNFPHILPENNNMPLRVQELGEQTILEIFAEISKPFNQYITPELIAEYFEWSFHIASTRLFQKGTLYDTIFQPTEIERKEHHLKRINMKLNIPMLFDIMNHSHKPNCTIEYPQGTEELENVIKQRIEAAKGELTPDDHEFILSITPKLKVSTTKPIVPGEQLTIPYSTLQHIHIDTINNKNEKEFASKLRTENNLSELFRLSLARVPHAIEHLNQGTYCQFEEQRYGFYSNFFANDFIYTYRQPTQLIQNWCPSIDYITTNFQSIQWDNDMKHSKSIELYLHPRYQTPKNDVPYFSSLSYHDAPIKYMLPSMTSSPSAIYTVFNPKYEQLLRDLPRMLYNNKIPVSHLSKIGWFGPTEQAQVLARLYACAGYYAPDVTTAKLDIIQSLPQSIRPDINDQNIIDSYQITIAQSQKYCSQRFTQRIEYVLGSIEKRIKSQLQLEKDRDLTLREWYQGFTTSVDDEHEEGMRIQLFFMSQLYQQYASSSIPPKPMSKTSIQLDQRAQQLDKQKMMDTKQMEVEKQKVMEAKRLELEQQKLITQQQLSQIPQLSTSLQQSSLKTPFSSVNSAATASIPPQQTSTRSASTTAPISTTSTTTSTTNTDQSTIQQLSTSTIDNDINQVPILPPTIQSSVLRYYQGILEEKNFDTAITSIHHYHHLSLISHINKVFATRLGVIDYCPNDIIQQLPNQTTISQEWYRCDGYTNPVTFPPNFRLLDIPNQNQSYGSYYYIKQPNIITDKNDVTKNEDNNNNNNSNEYYLPDGSENPNYKIL